jgi:hypothetical protein
MRGGTTGYFTPFTAFDHVRKFGFMRPIALVFMFIVASCGDTPTDSSATLVASEAPIDSSTPTDTPRVDAEQDTSRSALQPGEPSEVADEAFAGTDVPIPATTLADSAPPASTVAPFPSRCEGANFGQLGLIVLGAGVTCEEAQQVLVAYDGAEKAGSAAVGDAGSGWSCSTLSAGQRSTIDYDTGCASATASFTWLSDQSPEARLPVAPSPSTADPAPTPASTVLQPGQTETAGTRTRRSSATTCMPG